MEKPHIFFMILIKMINMHDDHYGCQEPPSLVQELCVDSGEQLCVLLGFRTTDDNCVDTLEADSERSQVGRF